MPTQTTGLLTAHAHSFEAEMRPGPIFQQLVRLSVVQRGKLGGKTVVTSLYLLVPPPPNIYGIAEHPPFWASDGGQVGGGYRRAEGRSE